MKNISLLTFFFVIPFLSSGQDCNVLPSDTTVCGFSHQFDFLVGSGSLTVSCQNETGIVISEVDNMTQLQFSECGVFELIFESEEQDCMDTLTLEVDDPSFTSYQNNVDIGLSYEGIDCPSGAVADCDVPGVSISISSGTPTPVWSFCSTSTCTTTNYLIDSVGTITDCVSEYISYDTISITSQSNFCQDTTQDAFIVLDTNGDTVTDNSFLDYLAQLQDSSQVDCSSLLDNCNFGNADTCLDSMVIDTTILPIPVRIGGQWTILDVNDVTLEDTTYFAHLGNEYELILQPGVKFYGPGELEVFLNQINITASNDTIRNFPYGFNLTLQWEEEWIIDTIQIIREKFFDSNDDCFACGGVSYNSGFNIPDIPDFPCGPVSIYYPSECECFEAYPNLAIQLIDCGPDHIWRIESLESQFQIIDINGAESMNNEGSSIDIIHPQNSIEVQVIDLFTGCDSYVWLPIENYIEDLLMTGGQLSCLNETTVLSALGFNFIESNYFPLNEAIWSGPGVNGTFGASVVVSSEGTYTASYTDSYGCTLDASYTVTFDDSDCNEENPYAEINCSDIESDVICNIMTLDDFDYLMPFDNNSNDQGSPFCNNEGSIDNPSWFSFIAFDGDYTINITPSNCFGSANALDGIQVSMFSDCSLSNNAYCNSEGSTQVISINSGNFVPGQRYYILIDGLSGSVCQYEIDIEGLPEEPELNPESLEVFINGGEVLDQAISETFCPGSEIHLNTTGQEIIGEYSWQINTISGDIFDGDSQIITNEDDVTISINSEGSYEVCLTRIFNGCEQFTWNGSICTNITIQSPDDEIFNSKYLCPSDLSEFDPAILNEENPNQDGLLGWQILNHNFLFGQNEVEVVTAEGCRYLQSIELLPFEIEEVALENPEKMCRNQSAQIIFQGNSDQIIEHEWRFGDASLIGNSSLSEIELRWDTEGIKTVELFTIDINGCENLSSTELLVEPVATVELSISQDTICISETLLVNIDNPNQLQESWTFQDGDLIEGTLNEVSFDSPGIKMISVVASNGYCTDIERDIFVYVEAELEPVILQCKEPSTDEINLEWNEVEGAYAYQVTINDQEPQVTTELSIIFSELIPETSYSIDITAMADGRCASTENQTICTTSTCPEVALTINTPESICISENKEEIVLEATIEGTVTSVEWQGDGIDGDVFTPGGLGVGTYSITAILYSAGCTVEQSTNLEIIGLPDVEVVWDDMDCYDQEFAAVQLLSEQSSLMYIYNGEQVNNELEMSPGDHTIQIFNQYGCMKEKSFYIEAQELPFIELNGTEFDIEGSSQNYSLEMDKLLEEQIDNIIWTANENVICEGVFCTSIEYVLEEDMDLEATIAYNDGCSISSSIRVVVEEIGPELYIPNVFSPNGDGINDLWFIHTNDPDLSILNIQIFDRWNNKVYTSKESSNIELQWNGTRNGQALSSGVYVYTIQYEVDGIVTSKYGDVTILK